MRQLVAALAEGKTGLPRLRTVFVGVPIGTALIGIAGSLLLIVYFGGRRGRALYGLASDRITAPDRG